MLRPLAFLSVLLLPLSGCAASATAGEEILVLEVAATTVPCVGEARQRCLQVRERGEEEWRLFYDPIEGFVHEEGFRYTLEVARRRAPKLIADASAYRWRLVRVIERVARDGAG